MPVKGSKYGKDLGESKRIDNLSAELAENVTNVKYFGAKGDGITDDTSAFEAAINSGKAVYVPPGTYYLGACIDITKSVKIFGAGDATKLISNGGDYYKDYGVTYAGKLSNKTFSIYSKVKQTYTITGDTFAAGTVDLIVEDTTGLSVGDTIYLMIGTNPYDSTEEYYRAFNTIKAIDVNSVTLTMPIPCDVPLSSRVSKFETYESIAENIEISNLCIDIKDAGHVQDQMFLTWHARNVNIHHIHFLRSSTAIEFLEGENCHAHNIQIDYCTNYHISVHPFNVWGVTNFSFKDIEISHMNNVTAFFGEATNTNGTIENININKTQDDVPDSTYIYVFHFVGMSTNINVKNVYINSKNKLAFATISQESTASFENISLNGSVRQYPLSLHKGLLTINGVKYFNERKATVYLPLKPNATNLAAKLPRGLYKSCRVYSNYGNTYLTQLIMETGANWLLDIHTNLSADGFYDVPQNKSYGDLFTNNEIGARRILATTTAGCPVNAYLRCEIEYLPESGYDVEIVSQRMPLFGASIPTTGTWIVGDRVYNSAPTAGQPKSWVCTVAGTPGTWVSEGNL